MCEKRRPYGKLFTISEHSNVSSILGWDFNQSSNDYETKRLATKYLRPLSFFTFRLFKATDLGAFLWILGPSFYFVILHKVESYCEVEGKWFMVFRSFYFANQNLKGVACVSRWALLSDYRLSFGACRHRACKSKQEFVPVPICKITPAQSNSLNMILSGI